MTVFVAVTGSCGKTTTKGSGPIDDLERILPNRQQPVAAMPVTG